MRRSLAENWFPCQQEWLRLRRRIRTFTHRDDAEDHLQTALANYYERSQGQVTHPEAYITRSALNLHLNDLKKAASGSLSTTGDQEQILELRDPAPSQEEAYAASQRMARFHEGCRQLPERTRQAFLLNRVEKMKYREIAVALGISESSVEKHIAKALVFLSSWMDQ
ncbi:iron-regulated sigma factor/transcriptional regulator [Gluconobacter frateurii NBRC 101659]|uniref:RNA polymerase sigma factor n=1 Tax=Gluconobacter japonicus TaxID=376620 RepID=UPI0006A02E1F|nr:iron-regulated sigma factor/transcriptional regulator [Gluconobacter frateurii NBRC 101659]